MKSTYCPACGLSSLAYCEECSHSWEQGTGITRCQFAPQHEGDRTLRCPACGGLVTTEGVFRKDGSLVLYPGSITKLFLDLHDGGAA